MTTRDFLDPRQQTQPEILALKMLSDRSTGQDRELILATCVLIADLRREKSELRQGLQQAIADCPIKEPHPLDFSLDDDPQAFEKEHEKWIRGDNGRYVLERTE